VASLIAVAVGWLVAQVLHISDVAQAGWYLPAATGLLAVGLFASTYGISCPDAKQNLRTVLVAVTAGVLAKAVLISTAMVAAFHRPAYLVLGVAVAQIDPLSVAAQRRRCRLSEEAKTILCAWASFDDPITMLLTIYLSAFALQAMSPGARSTGSLNHNLLSFGGGLVGNVLFAGGAAVVWYLLKAATKRFPPRGGAGPRRLSAVDAVEVLALVALVSLAVAHSFLLGLAVMGLFFRPAAIRSLDRVTEVAFFTAAGALGLVLVHGISLAPALVLGVAAFLAQLVVGLVITRGQKPRDRKYLALAQQNGITAIILALILEHDFPGSVGVIAPAIVVINLLHTLANADWDRIRGTFQSIIRAGLRRRLGPVHVNASVAYLGVETFPGDGDPVTSLGVGTVPRPATNV
jgi:hypothetical protein